MKEKYLKFGRGRIGISWVTEYVQVDQKQEEAETFLFAKIYRNIEMKFLGV